MSSSAQRHWMLHAQELSPALGVHVGLVLASAACAIFSSACLALRACSYCCCQRRRSQQPSLQSPSENAPDAAAPRSNPERLPFPQCAIRVTIEPNTPDERDQEREHGIDPSGGSQEQLPGDPITQSGGAALDAHTELTSSGTEPNGREQTHTAQNTAKGSQSSFILSLCSLDALMLWTAIYIIEVASLTLEMDAVFRHMPHSSKFHIFTPQRKRA